MYFALLCSRLCVCWSFFFLLKSKSARTYKHQNFIEFQSIFDPEKHSAHPTHSHVYNIFDSVIICEFSFVIYSLWYIDWWCFFIWLPSLSDHTYILYKYSYIFLLFIVPSMIRNTNFIQIQAANVPTEGDVKRGKQQQQKKKFTRDENRKLFSASLCVCHRIYYMGIDKWVKCSESKWIETNKYNSMQMRMHSLRESLNKELYMNLPTKSNHTMSRCICV